MRNSSWATFLATTGCVIGAAACGSTGSTCDEVLTCAPETGGADGGGLGGSGSGGKATAGSGGEASQGGAAGAGGVGGVSGAQGAGGAAGGSEADAGADAGDGARPCDESRTPDVESCLIDDDYAVFVAAGSPASHGTKAEPAATISEGITFAKQRGLTRILVCNASYPEAITLAAGNVTQPSLSFFGGFACDTWAPVDTARPSVAPAGAKPALTLSGITAPVVFQNIDFSSTDATAPGGSSIAVSVVNATAVTFRGVHVTAGKGAKGADGADGTQGADGLLVQAEQNGKPAVCDTPQATAPDEQAGAAALPAICGSVGGDGGPAKKNKAGGDGTPGDPMAGVTPPDKNNKGAAALAATDPGGDGSFGSPGDNGTAGRQAADKGTFSVVGFTPADGAAGSNGNPGQGGGGGGASRGTATCVGASGGAGGMGGCGGGHGTGGKGGGASVAIFVWDSKVTLENAVLASADGGAGGKGGNAAIGGSGRIGGSGGDGVSGSVRAGGSGGRGGDGGLGGPGSGGTGGPSYGVVYHGTAPDVKGTLGSITVKSGGAKGSGGTVQNGATAPDGFDGASAEMFKVTP